jgi:hypothetical protein
MSSRRRRRQRQSTSNQPRLLFCVVSRTASKLIPEPVANLGSKATQTVWNGFKDMTFDSDTDLDMDRSRQR